MLEQHLPLLISEFSPAVTFLNTATFGLEPESARRLMATYDEQRARGTLQPGEIDDIIDCCRGLIGQLLGRTADEIAISASASQLIGVIAESLPTGSRVLLADGDFTSVLFPFLARTDLVASTVPLADLANHVDADTELVAVSAVQSADGAVADLTRLASAVHAHGARLLIDVTQAAGWLPLENSSADFIVGGGYKWLLAPRGTAYLTGQPEALASLRPTAANWYGGDSRWDAIYGSPLRLAHGVRRLDLSPAWACWVGMEPALRLLLDVGIHEIHEHNVGLANRFLAGLGLPTSNSAIVSVATADGAADRLADAGIAFAGRAGKLRFSFHLYTTEADVDRAADLLTGQVLPVQ